MVNNRLEKVNDQFEAMSEAINKALEVKKEALVRMYRKDPRISRDDAVLRVYPAIWSIGANTNQTSYLY